jgi:hypothetical protein
LFTIQDGAEYLFSTSKEDEMKEWIVKINFHAKLAPAQQLTSYDRAKQALAGEVGFRLAFCKD